MSSSDFSSDLDARITAIVERTVGKMRDELLGRVHDTEARLRDLSQRLAGEPAAPAAAPEAPAAPAAEAAVGRMTELFEAVAAIDRGGSQQDVLASLLEEAGRFAGRSALLLTRSDAAQGWGSYGFEELPTEMAQIVLEYGEGPLASLAAGSGCVPLDADECAEFCRRLGAAPAEEGLLVPFVLRDRVAAALYVDRAAEDPPLARQPIQLLAYIGAQAVEGLALRERSETPTLKMASAAAVPGVSLWESAPEAALPAEPPPAEPMPAEPMPGEPEPAEPAPVEAAPVEVAAEEEVTVEEVAEPELAAEPEPEAVEAEPPDTREWDLPAAAQPAVEEESEEPTRPLDALAEAEAPPIVEEAAADDTWAVTADTELSAVETAAPPITPEAAPPEAAAVTSPTGETTEVRPPSDVAGPGWAFTASRSDAEAGDEAQHEEARRLARLLVTEIKLYNEEQVEEGRRSNDIYGRLKEDIDRSRQIFNERVDEEIRQHTDYFHEEMVRILAGGNAEALGT